MGVQRQRQRDQIEGFCNLARDSGGLDRGGGSPVLDVF